MSEMEAVTQGGGRKKIWWKVFAVALVVAVLAGVSFAVYKVVETIRNKEAEAIVEDNTDATAQAQEICDRISDEYDTNYNMLYSDATQMFEDEMEKVDKLERMFISVCYAEFMTENGTDPNAGPAMLAGIDVDGLNEPAQQYYYLILSRAFENVGDNEKSDYYYKKAIDLAEERR